MTEIILAGVTDGPLVHKWAANDRPACGDGMERGDSLHTSQGHVTCGKCVLLIAEAAPRGSMTLERARPHNELDDYQQFTYEVALYPGKIERGGSVGLVYTAMGLAGEVGELVTPLHNMLAALPNAQRTDAVNDCLTILGRVIVAARGAESYKRELREGRVTLPALPAPTELMREAVLKELGDVLWYLVRHSWEWGWAASKVLARNVAKLRDRAARKVLHGNGDDR